jgi:type IV pilus assembly protein PilB
VPDLQKNSYAMRLADTMVKRGLITQEQIDSAVSRSREIGQPLNESMVDLGFITAWELVAFVTHEAELPFVDIDPNRIQIDTINRIPAAMAVKYEMLPLGERAGIITMAMANPLTVFSLDGIRKESGIDLTPVLAKKEVIDQLINEYYGKGKIIADAVENLKDSQIELPGDDVETIGKLEALTSQPPVIKLVNEIILNAVQEGASDIHIEPRRAIVDLRTRVDGILYQASTIPRDLLMAIVSRVKIMANMDITERRAPQDGRIEVKMQGRLIDLRVSTFPTIYGEKIVMRILDKSAMILDLSSLGLDDSEFKKVDSLIKRPYGMTLIVGPTGSGKSTSLYAILNTINGPDLNVMTLEDPVEYEMSMVNQGQINPKAGLTFATGLRTLLRQDPDIIMVGEIRDLETAELAVRAALTGHLLFSTLHTMDAPSAPARLIDMGVEPFLISSAIAGVIAQRLVRKICPKCKTEYTPSKELLEDLGIKQEPGQKFYRGEGCDLCHNTGYKGRTGLYEVMTMNESIKKLIIKRAGADEIRRAAEDNGLVTLRQDGINKARAGVTTLEEVLRETAANTLD